MGRSRASWQGLRCVVAVACVGVAVRAAPADAVGYGEPIALPDDGSPTAAIVRDATGDGVQDVVLASLQRVRVYGGNGDGTFRPAQDVITGVNNTAAVPARIAAGTLDANPSDDFVVSRASHWGLYVLRSGAQGGFGVTLYSNAVGVTPGAMFDLVDWEGDGDLDVVGLSSTLGSSNGVFVRRNVGDGTFGGEQALQPAGGATAQEFAAADFDGDGLPDAALLVGNRIRLFRQDAGALVGGTDVVLGPASLTLRRLLAADLDADGATDLVAVSDGTAGDDEVHVVSGAGVGTFRAPVRYATLRTAARPVLADVNADGLPDLLTGPEVLLNRGDGRFGPPLQVAAADVVGVCAGDVDGDGRAELVVLDAAIAQRALVLPALEVDEPTISAATPATLFANTSRTLRLDGGGFVAGSLVDVGADVTVQATRVVAPTAMEVDVLVPADVSLGARVVEVVRPDGGVARADLLFSDGGDAAVASVTPSRVHAEDTVSLTLAGDGLTDGATIALGDGVAVDAAEIVDGMLRAEVSVAPDAAPGPRDVVLTNGTGVVTTAPAAFRVLPRRSIRLVAETGRMRVARRTARATLTVSGSISFNAFSPDGAFDPVTEDVEVRFGAADAPSAATIAADRGWRLRGPRAAWRSPRASRPDVSLALDLSRGTYRLGVRGADLAAPADGRVLVELSLGTETGTSIRAWRRARGGDLVLR